MSETDQEPEIPGKSKGTGMYIAGIAVMGVAIVALLVWRFKSPPPTPQIITAPPPASTTAPPPPQFAPPPPPKIEVEPEPTASASASGGKAVAGAGGPNPCGKCGEGEGNSSLSSAISSAAAGARGCYNRALQKGEVSGKMNVSVQVGSSGQVCGAAITNDTVGSPQVSSCVLSRFQGRSFPPPTRGCVVVNVPINFTIKQ
ncbi:MAG: AgmX/PglI C-terminal domain-containing protein [Polyangiaceae bacterium]|nr:AgmX/PglI C-terminal domain-containing protein [Polyangiaceae bacterium]